MLYSVLDGSFWLKGSVCIFDMKISLESTILYEDTGIQKSYGFMRPFNSKLNGVVEGVQVFNKCFERISMAPDGKNINIPPPYEGVVSGGTL